MPKENRGLGRPEKSSRHGEAGRVDEDRYNDLSAMPEQNELTKFGGAGGFREDRRFL